MDLRERAEALLKERLQNGYLKLNQNIEEVLQELQIHQIELELQNAELLESQKTLQETQRKYFNLYNFAPVGYFTLNPEGQIIECNLTAAQMLGQERQRILKRPLIRYLDPNSHRMFVEYLDTVFSGSHQPVCELRLAKNDEGITDVQVRAMIYSQSDSTQCLVAMTDITELKRAEQQAFRLALRQERLNILSEFVVDAAHEFRTPLLIISMQSHYMLMSKQPHEVKEAYDDIQDGIRQITDLLDDMLEMVRLNHDVGFETHLTSINELIDLTTTKISTRAHNKGHLLYFSLDRQLPLIYADPARLERMLYEVFDNAVNFMEPNGKIYISTWSHEDRVHIEVRDTGLGIAEENLPHVFDMFYRVDPARTQRGFGLGLSLAKTIVEQHHGTIRLDSCEGEGTTVRVSLPVRPPQV